MKANAETLVVLQVESADAVEQLPRILEVEDVDVVFIGPNDLSNSLGYAGQLDHPKVKPVLDRAVELILDSKRSLGIMVGNVEEPSIGSSVAHALLPLPSTTSRVPQFEPT